MSLCRKDIINLSAWTAGNEHDDFGEQPHPTKCRMGMAPWHREGPVRLVEVPGHRNVRRHVFQERSVSLEQGVQQRDRGQDAKSRANGLVAEGVVE